MSDNYVKQNFSAEQIAEAERQEALLDEMGIDRTESDKLRKTMLSADEAVCAKGEELERIRQHKGRKKDWDEFIDIKRRMGHVLHHSEFVRQLRIIVPNLIVAPTMRRNQLGLYTVRSTPVTEVPDYKGSEKLHFSCPIYIGWIEMGYMPEYEIDVVNEAQIPIGQKRGWRTVLLRMIVRWNYLMDSRGDFLLDAWGRKKRTSRASIITEDQTLKAFGLPTQGITASGYRLQLYNFRNAVPESVPSRR